MARLVSYVGFNNTNPSVQYDRISYASSTEVEFSDGYNTGIYGGYGLVVDSYGYLRGGVITSFTAYSGSQLVAKLDQFAISAVTVDPYIGVNDHAGFFSLVQAGNDEVFGSAGNDRLSGYGGNDYINAGGGNDFVYAGWGDDRITVGPGNTFVSGGEGFDMVSVPGSGGSYSFERSPEGWHFWSNSNQVNVNLSSIERILFSDGTMAYDINGNAGQAYRLYQAAFARDPDAAGLGYWIDRLDAGSTNLHAMADSFLYSAEFASIYGTPNTVSNAEYIELLYLNTLGRLPDQGGYAHWSYELNSGRMDRGDLLAHFSESAENRAQVAPEINDGIWYV